MSEEYSLVDRYIDWMRNVASTYRRILDVPRYRYLMDVCLDEYVEGVRFSMTDSEFQVFRAEIVFAYNYMIAIQFQQIEEYPYIRHIVEGGLDMPLPAHLAYITDLRSVFLESLYEAFLPRRLDRVVSPVRSDGLRDVFEDPPQLLE